MHSLNISRELPRLEREANIKINKSVENHLHAIFVCKDGAWELLTTRVCRYKAEAVLKKVTAIGATAKLEIIRWHLVDDELEPNWAKGLSGRERAVMCLLSTGADAEEIGAALGICKRSTVRYIRLLQDHLGVSNRNRLIKIAVENSFRGGVFENAPELLRSFQGERQEHGKTCEQWKRKKEKYGTAARMVDPEIADGDLSKNLDKTPLESQATVEKEGGAA